MSREITLQAGQFQEFYEVGDFLRILSAQGPLTIEFYSQGREVAEAINVSKGYAEKFERGNFDRVRLVSATTQAVQFVTRLGNVVEYNAAPIGDTAIVSSVPLDLTAATLLSMLTPGLPAAHYSVNTALSANVAENVFTAAANVNGAIIWSAAMADLMATAGTMSMLAKATAPANTADGQILMLQQMMPVAGGIYSHGQKEYPTRIAAGLGLWFITSIASGSNTPIRSCRYTLL